ncbi:MAG: glycosyltransferase family 9 protein [Aliarcobacter sp.]|nr:glycosyltransferase family 9 protein [Aliarcobacter sp.]
MIFFRVTQNINIKTTDGTMVNYFKFKEPSNLENETLYISTYDDFKDLREIFSKVDKEKYFAKVFNEEKVRTLANFPIELGITNVDEYNNKENSSNSTCQNIKKVDIYKQLKNIKKDEITIAIIGGVGVSISQIVSSCTALRLLHEKLNFFYKNLKFDVYLNASNNSYYTREKQIYQTQEYINNVLPLSITVKKLCEYDYFIDNSLSINFLGLDFLNYVDAWLFRFGIDYEKISDNQKYNQLNLSGYKVQDILRDKINEAKLKGKLLLFHPYSANINKSIPQTIAVDILKELLLKADDYMIVSTLLIDLKIKDDRFIDLTKESKNLNDFMYIISSMDKIITVDTSTYHISDAFMIPTITIFTDENYLKKIKYFKYTKAILIKDKSKNLSKFIYENDSLIINKFESWNKLKVNRIIKLLDTF